jgi:acetyl-CoA carboxylase biotin carboxyl carrier protein
MARHQIISPLPGTFYNKPSPGQPSYKSEGDTVQVGDIVGLIEIMKTFHEVQSDAAGTIASFLVDNEEPIQAGQPLVELKL